MTFPLQVQLPPGIPAIVRPIRRGDALALGEGLRRLSANSRVRRFFYDKQRYTADELERLTKFDPARHLALVCIRVDETGRELEGLSVARCFRDPPEPAIAEFAIATLDAWQRRGIGRILVQALAGAAWEAGIRRWRAVFLTENLPTRKLLNRVGELETERWLTADCIEATYALHAPGSRGQAATTS
jgi:GNAT superfamily N-acetyltransferase